MIKYACVRLMMCHKNNQFLLMYVLAHNKPQQMLNFALFWRFASFYLNPCLSTLRVSILSVQKINLIRCSLYLPVLNAYISEKKLPGVSAVCDICKSLKFELYKN